MEIQGANRPEPPAAKQEGATRSSPADTDERHPAAGLSRVLLFAVGLIPLALVAALALGMATGVGQGPLGEVDPGFDVAADFTLPTLDGETFTLSDYDDGPVFMYFWASWCVPCQEEAPLIQRLWPEYEQRGYTFVGVNILDTEADARAFIERFGLTFPNPLDDRGAVYLEYGVYGVPESFFLTSGRTVRQKFLGALTEEPFRSMLDRIASPGTN